MDNQKPGDLVLAFIEDYFEWNSEAVKLGGIKFEHSTDTHNRIQHSYRKLLDKYCRPGFEGEPIAFGTESSHEPNKEVIISEDIGDSKASIRTRHTDQFGFEAEHEYRFELEGSRWYLVAVDYIDGNEKYPGL